jgi:integrase
MKVSLAVTAGPHAGQSFAFDQHDTFMVGRGEEVHFRLPDDPALSRKHFLLEINPPLCRLLDLKSRTGTRVNGQKVEAADLAAGDAIQAGQSAFRLRRALTVAECQILVAATAASGVCRGRMTGRQRALLYRLALTTGLRRNELGSLVPASFRLNTDPPTVTVAGSRTKNRKTATLPLRQDLAAELRAALAGLAAGETIFPVTGRRMDYVIAGDLGDAGIAPRVDGRVVDFHALRTTFITTLALSGVPLTVAQKLARHSDPRLTANTYTHLGLADLGRAVESLPAVALRSDSAHPEAPRRAAS